MELPDVNVLIALFDKKHSHHEPAQNWFFGLQEDGWATCSTTENGLFRIVTGPKYTPPIDLFIPKIREGLVDLTSQSGTKHHYWNDVVSFRDDTLFDLSQIKGYTQFTDVYLHGLCQAHNATLITFDKAIPTMLPCIVNPHSELVRILTRER